MSALSIDMLALSSSTSMLQKNVQKFSCQFAMPRNCLEVLFSMPL